MPLTISSPDFEPGGSLDARFSKHGDNAAPRFRIDGVPEGAVELALVCHDPDAPMPQGFTHWTLYAVPPTTSELAADADESFRPGRNDGGSTGYVGPYPPKGHGVHHYYFWVYALDTNVSGEPSRSEFLEKYADNIIEQNRIVGTFES